METTSTLEALQHKNLAHHSMPKFSCQQKISFHTNKNFPWPKNHTPKKFCPTKNQCPIKILPWPTKKNFLSKITTKKKKKKKFLHVHDHKKFLHVHAQPKNPNMSKIITAKFFHDLTSHTQQKFSIARISCS